MKSSYVPDRGELVWLTFDPQTGHEQSGRRPALVISPKNYNLKAGLALVCSVTSHAKGYPFEVAVPEGSTIAGVVLADHVKSVDWRARRAALIEKAPAEVIGGVIARLAPLLGC